MKALAISAMGETFTPVAKDGSFLANSMVSPDARAVAHGYPAFCGVDRIAIAPEMRGGGASPVTAIVV